MDLSLVTAAVTAIRAAKDIGVAASAVRDWNLLAVEMSKMNEQLLRAQDALFSHNTQLLALQQVLFASKAQLREANELLAERGRYSLAQTDVGQWAYKETAAGAGDGHVPHYLCQPCFDAGRKSVLQYAHALHGQVLFCTVCKAQVAAAYVMSDRKPGLGQT